MAVLQVGDIKLDEVEARELLKKHQYMYFLSTANIVSLSYRSEKRGGKKTGRYVLHVGVIGKLPAEKIKGPCPRLSHMKHPPRKWIYQYRLLKRE